MGDLEPAIAGEGIPQTIKCPECGRQMDYMGLDKVNVYYRGRGQHHWYRHKGKPHHNIRLPVRYFKDDGWMETLRSECSRVYETLWDCRPMQACAC